MKMNDKINGMVSMEIPLLKHSKVVVLELFFEQTEEKKFLMMEKIKLGSVVVEETLQIALMKAYLKKFIQNKITPAHTSQYFEYQTRTLTDKNEKPYLERSLQVKGEKSLYIYELDAEAFLEVARDLSQGFNRIRLYDKYVKANITPLFTNLVRENADGSQVVEQFIYDGRENKSRKIVEQVMSEGFNPKTIKEILSKKR